MSTPCTERGYKVGQVFEVVDEVAGVNCKEGDIIILTRDDGSDNPFFDRVKAVAGSPMDESLCKSLNRIKRIWPPEESGLC